MKQYELWMAVLPPPAGRRPVLLLSRDEACARLRRLTAVEVTTNIRGIPQELMLGADEGLALPCVAAFDNIIAVPRDCFEIRIGALPGPRIAEVKRAVGAALAWPELTEPV